MRSMGRKSHGLFMLFCARYNSSSRRSVVGQIVTGRYGCPKLLSAGGGYRSLACTIHYRTRGCQNIESSRRSMMEILGFGCRGTSWDHGRRLLEPVVTKVLLVVVRDGFFVSSLRDLACIWIGGVRRNKCTRPLQYIQQCSISTVKFL